jgi:integrase
MTPDSFAAVAANWMKRHVEKEKLISQREYQRVLDKYILPALGEQPFAAIKRSEVSGLLDKIEDNNGPRQADLALSIMRGIAGWYSNRDDDYVSPFAAVKAKGMRRSRSKPRARILDDVEIRMMWTQAGQLGTFGAFAKLLLLTAQRRDAVRNMRWSDLALSDDGGLIWTMAKEERQKGNAGKIRLPAIAVQIINALPRFESKPATTRCRSNSHKAAPRRVGRCMISDEAHARCSPAPASIARSPSDSWVTSWPASRAPTTASITRPRRRTRWPRWRS